MSQAENGSTAQANSANRSTTSRSRSVSPASKTQQQRSKSRSRSPRHKSEVRRSMSRSRSPAEDRKRNHGRDDMGSPSPSPSAKRQRRSRSRSESRDRIAEAPVQPTATDTIQINNFVRPLRIDDVRELLSKYGNVESLTMDKFKTHAIVKFSSRNEAAEAYQNLQGFSFQPESGKTLSVSYIGGESSGASIPNSGASSVEAPAVELSNGIPPPATDTVTLDHLFKKTTALPPLYWLPKKI